MIGRNSRSNNLRKWTPKHENPIVRYHALKDCRVTSISSKHLNFELEDGSFLRAPMSLIHEDDLAFAAVGDRRRDFRIEKWFLLRHGVIE